MSTILDALRKAKQAPTQDSVDARPEVISGTSHNYLATAPDSPENQLRNLKMIVIVAGCIIAFLFILVIVLFAVVLRKMDTVPTSSAPPTHSVVQKPDLPPAAESAEPVPVAVATVTPQPTPIIVYIATPTPAPTPAYTAPVPVSINPTPVAPVGGESAPFEFPVQSTVGTLELRGILWDETAPMAMINGKSVREGSIISGYTVKTIEKSAVIVITPTGEEKILKP